MNSTFWYLDPPNWRGLAEEALDTKYELIACSVYDDHQHGGRRLSDLSVVVDPSRITDFTWVWGGDVLVSPRVLDLLEKHRVIGFETRPIKISYSKMPEVPPPELFELVVTGWGGFAAPAAGVSLSESCPACGHTVYTIAEPGRLIDEAAWDGSDLFVVWPLPGYRFVSDRLASILRQEKVSGVKAFPASTVPVKRGATVTPGSLAWSMPENRARELEQRYGIAIS